VLSAVASWGTGLAIVLACGWGAWQFAWPRLDVAWGIVPTGELIGAESPPEAASVHEPVAAHTMSEVVAFAQHSNNPATSGEAPATLPPTLTTLPSTTTRLTPAQSVQGIGGGTAGEASSELPTRYQRKPLTRDSLTTVLVQQVEKTGPAGEDSTVATTLKAIDELLAAGEVLKAHKQLSQLYWTEVASRPLFQERLEKTARVIFRQPQPHFIAAYTIQPGDQLRKIAGEYKLSWEYLAKLNQIDPKRIQVGKPLKVVRGPFAAHVSLSRFELTIHLQSYVVQQFRVGVGQDRSTPSGKLVVLEKIADPQYTDPQGRVIDGGDPKNPLGPRWLDLGNSYGIHGTIDPASIGQAASRGCIRLKNDDAIEVYDYLVKGSEVVIEP
jgi:LysM repeat protein